MPPLKAFYFTVLEQNVYFQKVHAGSVSKNRLPFCGRISIALLRRWPARRRIYEVTVRHHCSQHTRTIIYPQLLAPLCPESTPHPNQGSRKSSSSSDCRSPLVTSSHIGDLTQSGNDRPSPPRINVDRDSRSDFKSASTLRPDLQLD